MPVTLIHGQAFLPRPNLTSVHRKLLAILACPVDRSTPLEMIELDSRGDTIVDGVLICSSCGRYFPVIDEIPAMLPDNLRSKKEDVAFLEKWGSKLPEKIVNGGKPWSL